VPTVKRACTALSLDALLNPPKFQPRLTCVAESPGKGDSAVHAPGGRADPDPREIFDRNDLDFDGTLDHNEFAAAVLEDVAPMYDLSNPDIRDQVDALIEADFAYAAGPDGAVTLEDFIDEHRSFDRYRSTEVQTSMLPK
jgi:hypothetical protein